MKSPMFSIIVPVYNIPIYDGVNYFEQCLNSIMAQTFTDIEIILVNDGSVDNALSVLQSFAQKDQRIVVIDKQNGGTSSARNVGIKVAQGEYIMFVDSDDYINPKSCELFLEHIRANAPSPDIIVADFKEIKGKYTRISKWSKDPSTTTFTSTEFLKRQLKARTFQICIWTNAYRKDFLIANDLLFDEDIAWIEDLQFSQRVYLKAKSIVVADFIACTHHISTGSFSTKLHPNYIKYLLKVFAQFETIYQSLDDAQLKTLLYDNLIHTAFTMFMYLRLYRKPYWQQYRGVFKAEYAHSTLCKLAVRCLKISPIFAYYTYRLYEWRYKLSQYFTKKTPDRASHQKEI